MDPCVNTKIEDITTYCNCSASTSENLEEDDYNFLNYKEFYFEPSPNKQIESFWKYLDCKNVPLPRVARPKPIKKRKWQKTAKSAEKRDKLDEKQVKLDEKLKQDAAFKSTKWADKLAYIQNKGYDKMLAQKKSCKICNNDDFDPLFADMSCRELVKGLPAYRQPVHKKVGRIMDKHECISTPEISSDPEVDASLSSTKLAQKSDKFPNASKTTVHSLIESTDTLQSTHSVIDISQESVYDKMVKNHYEHKYLLSAYSQSSQSNTGLPVVQLFNTKEFLDNTAASNTEIKIGSHSTTRRQKKIMFHTKQNIRRSAPIIKSICSISSSDTPIACVSSMLQAI